MKPKRADAVYPAGPAQRALASTPDDDMPPEVRIANGVRGRYFPKSEPERSRALLERVRALQRTCAELREASEEVVRLWRKTDSDPRQRARSDPLADAVNKLERALGEPQ